MSTVAAACRRCHVRKIKCDSNKPACRPCTEAQVPCQPHVRQRRVINRRNEEDVRQRLAWLEDGITRHLNVDIRLVKTGTNLGSYFQQAGLRQSTFGPASDRGNSEPLNDYEKDDFPECSARPTEGRSREDSVDVAPDISLLTLNATGETRYLGPSSGSFFAKYASDFARTFLPENMEGHSPSESLSTGCRRPGERLLHSAPSTEIRISQILTQPISKYLMHCYFKWVHPLYPVLHAPFRRIVLEPLSTTPLEESITLADQDDAEKAHLIMYYLVLALGAIHATSVDGESEQEAGYLEYQEMFSSKKLSPDSLFLEALELLDSMAMVLTLPLRIHIIQILLLICIYGGYKPSGNRHWQLAGIAIRISVEIGLHRHRDNWKFSKPELDRRRRVFWTAYAIELTAAFNLGRPPSIPDEHIDTPFPEESPDIVMGLHQIRHRRIQSRVLNKMYCAPERLNALSDLEKNQILNMLQSELDSWKSELAKVYLRSSSVYPLQYWERLYYATTTALHRPTPLFPQPSADSTMKCLRAAGQFIDIHHYLVKSTSMSQSWMLLQGMLLSGITMLVTARANAPLLITRQDFSVFEIMEWNRKCSLVLTIMSERWSDKSISMLETKYSLLANDTLKSLLATKDNISLGQTAQGDHPQSRELAIDGGMTATSGYGPAAIQNENGFQITQHSDWPYQVPNSDSAVGIGYPNQTGMGTEVLPSNEELSQEDLSGLGFGDALPLENFFGGDDLFNIWEPFPMDYDTTSYFGNCL